jgi:hypothetical protein
MKYFYAILNTLMKPIAFSDLFPAHIPNLQIGINIRPQNATYVKNQHERTFILNFTHAAYSLLFSMACPRNARALAISKISKLHPSF